MTTGGQNPNPGRVRKSKRFKFSRELLVRKLSRWLDEWRLAGSGIVLATKNRKFFLAAALTFVIFGTLMNLFSGSTAALDLFWQVNIVEKFRIILSGFLGLFGIGRNFLDWILLFSVSVLQSILIGLVALVWGHKRRASLANTDNLQNAGLAAGLAVLGTGCPTCGTTLLAPLIGTLFSTSSYTLAGTVSGILTAAAVVIALLTMKRLGNDAYAMIVSEKYQKRHKPKSTPPANPAQSASPPKNQPKKESHHAKNRS